MRETGPVFSGGRGVASVTIPTEGEPVFHSLPGEGCSSPEYHLHKRTEEPYRGRIAIIIFNLSGPERLDV